MKNMDLVTMSLREPSRRREGVYASAARGSSDGISSFVSAYLRDCPSFAGYELASAWVPSSRNSGNSLSHLQAESGVAGLQRSISCTPRGRRNRTDCRASSGQASAGTPSVTSSTCRSPWAPPVLLVRAISEPAASMPSSMPQYSLPLECPLRLRRASLFSRLKGWAPRLLQNRSERRRVVVVPPTRQTVLQASAGGIVGISMSRVSLLYSSGPSTIISSRSAGADAGMSSAIGGGEGSLEESDYRVQRNFSERGEPEAGERRRRADPGLFGNGPVDDHMVQDSANRPVGSSLLSLGHSMSSTASTISMACFIAIGFTSMINWLFLFELSPSVTAMLHLFSQERSRWGYQLDLPLFAAYQLSRLLVLVSLLCLGGMRKEVLLFGGWISVFVLVFLTPFMAYLPASSGSTSVFVLCAITGMSSGFLLGGGFSFAGALSPDFVAAFSIGHGWAAAYASSLAVFLAVAPAEKNSAFGATAVGWSFYIVAALFAVVSVIGISWVSQQPWAIATFKRVEKQRLQRMETYMARHEQKLRNTRPMPAQDTAAREGVRERREEGDGDGGRGGLVISSPSPSGESYTSGNSSDLEAGEVESGRGECMSDAVLPRLEQQSPLSSISPGTTASPLSRTLWGSSRSDSVQDSPRRCQKSLPLSRCPLPPRPPLPRLPFRTFYQVVRCILIPDLLSLFLTFFITRNAFPRLGPVLWNFSRPFPLSLLVFGAIFVWGDLLGRCLPLIGRRVSVLEKWLCIPRKFLLLAVLLRALFYIPFVLGGRLHDTVILNDLWWYAVITFGLGLTHGWTCTLSFIYAVGILQRLDEKEFTGPLVVVAFSCGTVVGLFSSYFY